MNIKKVIPCLLLVASGFSASCQRVARAVAVQAPKIEDCRTFQTILTDTFSHQLSDEAKVVNYNKLLKKFNSQVSNYIVVDKKNCVVKVYSPDGDVLYKTEVALGRNVGDKRAGGYLVPGAELRAYTTPGEFTITREGSVKGSKNEKLYGQRILVISGDHTQEIYKGHQTLALHQVPATPMGKLRINVLKNKTIDDNRVSFGCVNFLAESFDKLRTFIKGKGTKVYILPEEVNNSLHLEKQADGSYKFFQTKYRYESQEPKTIKPATPAARKDTVAVKDTIKQDIQPEVSDTISKKNSEVETIIPDTSFSEIDADTMLIP